MLIRLASCLTMSANLVESPVNALRLGRVMALPVKLGTGDFCPISLRALTDAVSKKKAALICILVREFTIVFKAQVNQATD